MKPIVLVTGWVFCLCLGITLNAQISKLPAVELFTLDGIQINTAYISNDNMPMILVFFKTYDNECCENLYAICEAHEEMLAEKGVKMIAICIDCVGKIEHVKPFVYGHGLDIEVYVDKNGDLKRKMGIPDAPYTILYDQKMEVYCKYNGYCAGSQEMVCEKMNECLNKMALSQ
ncbi:MAG: redoxin domain-containing protein [Bacteroidales bacterium]|nr:redoxin domain-containing protein [Bacteroidales bacterium]